MHHGLDYFKARLASMMGGRAAERLIYGQTLRRRSRAISSRRPGWPATWSRTGA